MADVTLQRAASSDDGTPGTWTHTSGWNCNTLELTIPIIPAGVWRLEMQYSPHFSRFLYHILNVPGHDALEVHAGNWAGDVNKGKFSDVRGCILQGHGYAKIAPYPQQLAIINSRLAVDQWIKFMDSKDFTLEILDV